MIEREERFNSIKNENDPPRRRRAGAAKSRAELRREMMAEREERTYEAAYDDSMGDTRPLPLGGESGEEPESEKSKKKNSKFARCTFAVSGIAIGLIYAFILFRIFFGGSLADGLSDNISNIAFGGETVEGKAVILMVGCDKIASNTDTIMLGILDYNENKADLISIPRDTRVPYGKGNYSKINAIYHMYESQREGSGIVELRNKVYEVTGIYADHYAMINTACFRDVVDELGGVSFDVPQNMDYEDPVQDLYIHLKKGYQRLNGDRAEQLVRYRYGYANADITRTEVQRDFIKALIEQKANTDYISKASSIYSIFEEECATDLSLKEAMKYATALAKIDSENIRSHILPGESKTTGLGSCWICDASEMKSLCEELGFADAPVKVISLPEEKNSSSSSKDSSSSDKSESSKSDKKSDDKDDEDDDDKDGKKSKSDKSEDDGTDKDDDKNKKTDSDKTTPSDEKPDIKTDSKKDESGAGNKTDSNKTGGDTPKSEKPQGDASGGAKLDYPDGL